MTIPPLDDLLQIVRNGGSIDLHAAGFSTEDLVQLGSNTQPNSTVTMRGIGGRSKDELLHISRNGAGRVIIVF